MLSGKFNFTQGFGDLWNDWCVYAESHPPFEDVKFDGYIGRRRTHLMKLSMIVSAARGINDLVLSRDDLEIAIQYLEEAENKMGLVFRGVGRSDTSEMIYKATNYLINSKSNDIPYWLFSRYFSNDMDKFTMDRILNTLEASKIVKVVNRPGADTIIKVLESREKIIQKFNDLKDLKD